MEDFQKRCCLLKRDFSCASSGIFLSMSTLFFFEKKRLGSAWPRISSARFHVVFLIFTYFIYYYILYIVIYCVILLYHYNTILYYMYYIILILLYHYYIILLSLGCWEKMRVDLSIYFSPTVEDFLKQFRLIERDFHCASFDIFLFMSTLFFWEKKAEVRKKSRCRNDVDSQRSRKLLWKKTEGLGWEVLSHPHYGPDLAPSDYHLFRSMQHSLAERKFTNRKKSRALGVQLLWVAAGRVLQKRNPFFAWMLTTSHW